MGNGECRIETRHTRRFKKSTPTYTPTSTTDGDVCIDSHGRSQYCVSRTICALQWQRSACRDWSWCTSTRTQRWMLNPSFISSLIRKTGA
jgi:hypothetical protein